MKTHKAKHLFGYERQDGKVDWRDTDGHYVGTTRHGDGYQVTGTKELTWVQEGDTVSAIKED